jgi:integrase
MSTLFKITITQYWLRNCWIDAEGNPCAEGTPGARFVERRRVKPDTPGAKKVVRKSTKWYARIPGNPRPVPLSANKVAAQQMLAALLKKHELGTAGISDPFELHRKRPLLEHLDDWQADLAASGATAKHVLQTVACARRVLNGCQFAFIADLSASVVQRFLGELRDRNPVLPPLDVEKDMYTKRETAAAVGVKISAVTALIRRHRLAATGQGKARRYPKATVEALRAARSRGRSIKTSNLYLDAVKQFAAWLVQDRRADENPLAHLAGGNVKVDRRHDRQTISAEDLRLIVKTARQSEEVFRGLIGSDRAMLYSVACASGFRAAELASLCPMAFDLDAEPPAVTLSAEYAKNGKTAVQPLPPDVASALREYLAGRPADQPVWPGVWFTKAAEMLRIDLKAAGIPYVLEGPDGLRYADFHALRHSFISMLDKSGATLKEAMQLARHSDPRLTMAVYGRAQLHDLGQAVGRLPSLMGSSESAALKATGTDGAPGQKGDAELVRFARRFAHSDDGGCQDMTGDDRDNPESAENPAGHKPLPLQGFGVGCEGMIGSEGNSPTRTRTWNKPVNSRLLYH